MPSLAPELHRLFVDFAVPGWPDGFVPVRGSVLPFSAEAMSRSLTASAVNISPPDELIELYRDGDRFWVVDDRWGITELHLLRRQWRSWILPQQKVDTMRCAEMAVLWPLAQLLRLRGLNLIPGVAVAKEGWGALILCPFGIEPELSQLLRHGYRVVGRRWTALREEEHRIAMLRMPGPLDRHPSPPRFDPVDFSTGELPRQELNHAFCDAVLLVPPGRRATAAHRVVAPSESLGLLRRSWPLVDLPVGARATQISAKLAQVCPVHELQLSRNPLDLLYRLDDLRKAAKESFSGKRNSQRSTSPAL